MTTGGEPIYMILEDNNGHWLWENGDLILWGHEEYTQADRSLPPRGQKKWDGPQPLDYRAFKRNPWIEKRWL